MLIDILEISSQEKLYYVINMRVYLRMHTTITDLHILFRYRKSFFQRLSFLLSKTFNIFGKHIFYKTTSRHYSFCVWNSILSYFWYKAFLRHWQLSLSSLLFSRHHFQQKEEKDKLKHIHHKYLSHSNIFWSFVWHSCD